MNSLRFLTYRVMLATPNFPSNFEVQRNLKDTLRKSIEGKNFLLTQKRIAAKWRKEQGDFCCFDEDPQLTVLLDTLNLDVDVMLVGNCHLKKVCNAVGGNVSKQNEVFTWLSEFLAWRILCWSSVDCIISQLLTRCCSTCELQLLKPFLGGIQHTVPAQAAGLQMELEIQHAAVTEHSKIYPVSLIPFGTLVVVVFLLMLESIFQSGFATKGSGTDSKNEYVGFFNVLS